MNISATGKPGFTLIELSIVLVIIGLIVGGVLVGQDLIKAAQLRTILSEKDSIYTAIQTFRGKYDYLPGDFPNTNSILNVYDGNGTMGGNGNGVIDDVSTTDVYPYFNENDLFWRHLGAANMIPLQVPNGFYDGCYTPGVDTLASKYGNGSGYAVIDNVAEVASPTQFYNSSGYQNVLTFGAQFAVCGHNLSPFKPVLTPADVYSLDKKIDDGLPASGTVITMGETVPTGTWIGDGNTVYQCATSNVASTAQYDLSLTTPTCILAFTNMW